MKPNRIFASALLLFNAAGGLIGGYYLISAPNGHSLGLPLSLLEPTPFRDFLIPGIILFTLIGMCSLVTAVWVILQWPDASLMLMCQGVLLTGWIVIQIILIRQVSFLHLVFGGSGLLFLWQGFTMQKSRKRLHPPRPDHRV